MPIIFVSSRRFFVIAMSEATKQSSSFSMTLDCFASLAMTMKKLFDCNPGLADHVAPALGFRGDQICQRVRCRAFRGDALHRELVDHALVLQRLVHYSVELGDDVG